MAEGAATQACSPASANSVREEGSVSDWIFIEYPSQMPANPGVAS